MASTTPIPHPRKPSLFERLSLWYHGDEGSPRRRRERSTRPHAGWLD